MGRLPAYTNGGWPAPRFMKLGCRKAGTRHRLLTLPCCHSRAATRLSSKARSPQVDPQEFEGRLLPSEQCSPLDSAQRRPAVSLRHASRDARCRIMAGPRKTKRRRWLGIVRSYAPAGLAPECLRGTHIDRQLTTPQHNGGPNRPVAHRLPNPPCTPTHSAKANCPSRPFAWAP